MMTMCFCVNMYLLVLYVSLCDCVVNESMNEWFMVRILDECNVYPFWGLMTTACVYPQMELYNSQGILPQNKATCCVTVTGCYSLEQVGKVYSGGLSWSELKGVEKQWATLLPAWKMWDIRDISTSPNATVPQNFVPLGWIDTLDITGLRLPMNSTWGWFSHMFAAWFWNLDFSMMLPSQMLRFVAVCLVHGLPQTVMLSISSNRSEMSLWPDCSWNSQRT